MKSAVCIALLVVLGVLCASSVSATELVTPELQEHLSAVHEAVFTAEESLRAFDADDAALAAEDALSDDALAFLEMHADMDSEADVSAETDADAEMEAAFGMDEEDQEAFVEVDADTETEAETEAEADADSEADAEAETGVAGTVVMKMEQGQTIAAEAEATQESELNAEAGSVTVPDYAPNHAQDADPIMSEQMEMQAAIDSYQMLEADSEAEVDAEAELEAEADAEAEVEAESELEAEPLPEAQATEDGVAYTKCGKKIIYEKKEESAPVAAPEMQ